MRAQRPTAPLASERGSAYLFVLLALLVLTAIGLSLVVITQTEVQIGGAEKNASRVLYGADSGVRIQFALSRFGATKSRRLALDSTTVLGDQLVETVDLSPFYPIQSGPCALCSVNWGEERYWAVDYVVNAQAQRNFALTGGVQAQKRLSTMFFIQPERDRKVDESIRTYDPTVTDEDDATPGLEVIKY
jgi:hypothetical protein